MTTGLDIITQALKKSGVLGQGRPPSATEQEDALADLNDMINQWSQMRWMVWGIIEIGLVSTGQITPYTVGPAGNFAVTPAPRRLEGAYLRQLNNNNLPVDVPLEVIPAREQYARLSLKTLSSFSLYVFLDTKFPVADLYCYPWPNATIYSIYILMKDVVPILALDTDITNMPLMYIPALKFNLARRLRQAYGKGMKPDQELNRLAGSSLEVIQNANLQIPELVMPKILVSMSSGYNILNDQFGGG